MQRSGNSKNAGFSSGEPWLPITSNVEVINVENQTYIKGSILNMYRKLLKLRNEYEALTIGSFIPQELHCDCLMFKRQGINETLLVILNFSDKEETIELKEFNPNQIIFTAYMDLEELNLNESYKVRPNEGIIVLLNK